MVSVEEEKPSASAFLRSPPVWLDTAMPDVLTGIRAAIATVVPFGVAAQSGRHELVSMAIGGWLGTLADPGGSRGRRAASLVGFTLLASGSVWLVARASAISAGLTVAIVAVIAFLTSLLRALGAGEARLGMKISITAAISAGALSGDPWNDSIYFAAGALVALVLSSIVWPVWTHLPVRHGLAKVFLEMSSYAAAIATCMREEIPQGDDRWVTETRVHVRRVRGAIEETRAIALAIRGRNFGESRAGSGFRMLLGMAESQFLLLVTVAEQLQASLPETRSALARDRLQALSVIYTDLQRSLIATTPRTQADWPETPAGSSPDDVVEHLTSLLQADARAASSLAARPDGLASYPAEAGAPSAGAREALRDALRALRDAVAWRSPFTTHGLRVALAVAVAVITARALSPTHASWLTVTTLVVLQPYAGATIQRAAERVVGTILGSVAAAGLARLVQGPAMLALIMFPLSVAAFITRPRSYRLFTFFLTPIFVLLSVRHPGDWWTAAARVGDAIIGGAIALVAAVLIFPSRERPRLRDALDAMLAGVREYVQTVLESLDRARAVPEAKIIEARRTASMSISEAETSLERLVAEPLRNIKDAQNAMQLITHARRLSVAVTAVDTLANHAAHGLPIDLPGSALAFQANEILRGETAARSKRRTEPPEIPASVPVAIAAALRRVLRLASLLRDQMLTHGP